MDAAKHPIILYTEHPIHRTASSQPIKNSSVQDINHNMVEKPCPRVTCKIKVKSYITNKLIVGRRRMNGKNYLTNSKE